MRSNRKKSLLWLALGLPLVLLAVACGDDSTAPNNGTDGGLTDGSPNVGDGSPPKTDGGSPDANVDGGPCDFNAYVLDLVNNHTTSTDLPTTNLGDTCTDTQTLFPQSTF